MIYLIQNTQEFNYDVRAIILAFFERKKIIEIKENETIVEEPEFTVRLFFGEGMMKASISEKGKIVICMEEGVDYRNTQNGRILMDQFLYRLLSSYTGKTLPWGILTGIRPTKIVSAWMEQGMKEEEIEKHFEQTYLTTSQKACLCTKVAKKEREILETLSYQDEYSIYIGIPFCPTTCLYCSFASFPVEKFGEKRDAYLAALEKEMKYVADHYKNKKLTTIYVGGGTPTALEANQLECLLRMITTYFSMEYVKEFTVEAGRPDSITKEKLLVLKQYPVTRISINPQTMNDKTLEIIGRRHTSKQTIDAFLMARELGFDNINMDIITGLPGEEIEELKYTLSVIQSLAPESLTVHSLAIKRAAMLNREMEQYQAMVKGSTDEMLCLVDEVALQMGMNPYYMYRQKNIPGNLENIGYAKPGLESLYNILIMEEKQDIIAMGAGASTKYVYPETRRIARVENVKNVDHYIQRIDEMIDRKRGMEA